MYELIVFIRGSYPDQENVFSYWYDRYKEMFEFFFKEDVFFKIRTAEEFEYYRDLILEINGIDFEKPNPNPEIQRPKDLYNELLKNKKGSSVSFESKVSSVATTTSVNVMELTLYQLEKYFERIVKIKDYETRRIFRMFDDKVELENWFTDIVNHKEEITISAEEVAEVKFGELEELAFKKNKE